jgi:hypothetical protein
VDDQGVGEQIDRGARHSRALEVAVRAGLVAYGAVHLLVAWVAVRLAFGAGPGSATGTGALTQLAGTTRGKTAVGVMAVAFVALVLWQVIVAAVGFRDRSGWSRIVMRLGAAFRCLTYGYLAVASARLVLSGRSGAGRSPGTMTARLMALPVGTFLVAMVGLAVMAMGVGLGVFGLKKGFLPQLDHQARTAQRRVPIVVLGQVGYSVKGAAFTIIGLLLGWAAITHDPHKSGGLDQALQELLGKTLGVPAIVVAGTGIGCFGLYLLALGRHLDADSITS